jgi:hypothetical protein
MSFAAITLCVASQLVLIFVVVYFVIDSVREFCIYPRIYLGHSFGMTGEIAARMAWCLSRYPNWRTSEYNSEALRQSVLLDGQTDRQTDTVLNNWSNHNYQVFVQLKCKLA